MAVPKGAMGPKTLQRGAFLSVSSLPVMEL